MQMASVPRTLSLTLTLDDAVRFLATGVMQVTCDELVEMTRHCVPEGTKVTSTSPRLVDRPSP